jgi:antitoxin component YwqK of YwqJK toxin-antitoxin module
LEEGTYKNGKLNGIVKNYSENKIPQLKSETIYKDGIEISKKDY